MEVSQGPDFSGDPFDVRIMNERTNPNSFEESRLPEAEPRRARRETELKIYSCISDMLASGAEGHADVLGAHICTG